MQVPRRPPIGGRPRVHRQNAGPSDRIGGRRPPGAAVSRCHKAYCRRLRTGQRKGIRRLAAALTVEGLDRDRLCIGQQSRNLAVQPADQQGGEPVSGEEAVALILGQVSVTLGPQVVESLHQRLGWPA